MNILLTGASGFVGSNLMAALSDAGHQVRPVSRANGHDFASMLAPEDWLPLLAGVDAVINSVGIIGESGSQRFAALHAQAPAALFRACARAGVRRVVQISALGADESAFSAYHLSKRTADDVLRGLDLDWFVLRPAMIYGRGSKSAALFMQLASLPLIPVIGDGQQKMQPVHISDVVAVVLHSLDAAQARQTIDIVGPETVSFVEWLQRMRQSGGRSRARVLPVPVAPCMALMRLGGAFSPMLRTENLRMLLASYQADVRPLAQFLGRMPRIFEPRLLDSDASTAGSAS